MDILLGKTLQEAIAVFSLLCASLPCPGHELDAGLKELICSFPLHISISPHGILLLT